MYNYLAVRSTKHLTQLLALQELAKVGNGHLGLRKVPSLLGSRHLPPGAIQVIKLAEGRLGPDAETANMTTRSQLQQVQLVHADGVDTRNVPEGLDQSLVAVVDDQGAQLLDTATVAHLALASTHPLGLVHLLDIIPSLDLLQEDHSLLGLGVGLNLVVDDQGHLRDVLDLMTYREKGDSLATRSSKELFECH